MNNARLTKRTYGKPRESRNDDRHNIHLDFMYMVGVPAFFVFTPNKAVSHVFYIYKTKKQERSIIIMSTTLITAYTPVLIADTSVISRDECIENAPV